MRPFALTHVRLAALLDAHNSHKSNKKFCNKNREMAFSTKINRLVRVKVDLFYILRLSICTFSANYIYILFYRNHYGVVDAIHAHWGDLVRKTMGSTCTTALQVVALSLCIFIWQ